MSAVVEQLEAAWREACRAQRQNGSERADLAEQSAWDAYSDACHDVQQCLQPGCRAICPDYSYCPDHR